MAGSAVDALLALHDAAIACTAVAVLGFSVEQAANGQAVVDVLRILFQPRPSIVIGAALEWDAPLLDVLPREIVTAVLHHLDTRDLARFAATCRALYRHAPPDQVSVVVVALRERAEYRGSGGAGPFRGQALGCQACCDGSGSAYWRTSLRSRSRTERAR